MVPGNDQIVKFTGPLLAFGEKTCHPERSEGSQRAASQILHCAQDDKERRMTSQISLTSAHGKSSLQITGPLLIFACSIAYHANVACMIDIDSL